MSLMSQFSWWLRGDPIFPIIHFFKFFLNILDVLAHRIKEDSANGCTCIYAIEAPNALKFTN